MVEEEVIIALNEEPVSSMRTSSAKLLSRNENGELVDEDIETVAGRLIFNQFVPEQVGFVMNC
jgi:DNA-directed RNA polymerase subunit beta'